MSIGKQKPNDNNMVVISTKIKAEQAELLNAICNSLGVDTYKIFQMFFYVLTKASAPMHDVSPEIRKIMTMMETDADWQNAFNLANPDQLKVAQMILILEQENKKGFGAVLIDRNVLPGMEPRMTENVDDILERVAEVTMYGIYRRIRTVGRLMGKRDLSDILLTMLDVQATMEMEEESKVQMQGEAMYDSRGRRIEYGKRTKSHHHRTPDGEALRQLRLNFEEVKPEQPDLKDWEGEHKGRDMEDEFKPFGSEW